METDNWLSAGDTVPDCVLDCPEGAFEWVLAVDGLIVGGRIGCFLLRGPGPGRGNAAMDY